MKLLLKAKHPSLNIWYLLLYNQTDAPTLVAYWHTDDMAFMPDQISMDTETWLATLEHLPWIQVQNATLTYYANSSLPERFIQVEILGTICRTWQLFGTPI